MEKTKINKKRPQLANFYNKQDFKNTWELEART